MSPRRRFLILLLAPVPWVVLFIHLAVAVPRAAKFFAEHGLQVPHSTRLVLDVSARVRGHLFFALVATLVAATVSVLAARAVLSDRVSRHARLATLLAVFGVPCALFVFTWLGMDAVYRRLDEGLSK